jgi:hypothetical protein
MFTTSTTLTTDTTSTTSSSAARARAGSRRTRAVGRLLTAALLIPGAVAATAAPASAAQTCTGARDSNVCLSIDRRADGNYNVHVGIDAYMPLHEAQEYVDDPGVPFTVWLRGDDGSPVEYLFHVPITTLSASAGWGLSADFDTVVSGRSLDEDYGSTDEVRAQVWLVDTDTNRTTKTFLSNRLVGNWN